MQHAFGIHSRLATYQLNLTVELIGKFHYQGGRSSVQAQRIDYVNQASNHVVSHF
jgi:hypothetical protein